MRTLPHVGPRVGPHVGIAALAILTLGACEGPRTLSLISVLPKPCGAAAVSTLRVRGLGDFPPAPAQAASLGVGGAADLDLPRGTRVVSIEGLGPSGQATLGRTAPVELGALWDAPGEQHVAPLAYGPPDTFCATDDLAYARAEHHATLLLDGSVLLSGGVDRDGHPVVALERYLPTGDATRAVARFTPVGSGEAFAAINARSVLGHDATRLVDGRVLLSGGAPTQGGVAEGIAYEGAQLLSADGMIEAPPRLLDGGPRAFHAGLLLRDGRVLLTGGCSELAGGACASGRALASVMIYEPAGDRFVAGPSLLQPRFGHQALYRDDGLVVLVGGVGADGAVLQPELYDPDEARGSSLTGPLGGAVTLDSGLVVALDGNPSGRVSSWSARDEAPRFFAQLPSARTAATLTALEDGLVLVAGGAEGGLLASQSAVLAVGGAAQSVPGFAARGHTATRLLDGTVLVAGGFDGGGLASAQAAIFIHSLTGPMTTPPTLGFDEGLGLTPSRPGRVAVVGGILVIDGGTVTRVPEVFARLSGPDLSGPTGTGFEVQVLAGRGEVGEAEAALLFGEPGRDGFIAVLVAVGQVPRFLIVRPDRPGLPAIEERAGCAGAVVAEDELPRTALAPLRLTLRGARLELASATRTLLACDEAEDWAPTRGAFALGARAGILRYDNLQITR